MDYAIIVDKYNILLAEFWIIGWVVVFLSFGCCLHAKYIDDLEYRVREIEIYREVEFNYIKHV
jgi:hypothetical protein